MLIVKLKSGKSVSSAWHGNLTKPGFAQFSSLYEVCALEAEKKKRVFAIYQILLGWKILKYYYETDELPNPRPTQPKKK